jgi:hypothetical protein
VYSQTGVDAARSRRHDCRTRWGVTGITSRAPQFSVFSAASTAHADEGAAARAVVHEALASGAAFSVLNVRKTTTERQSRRVGDDTS